MHKFYYFISFFFTIQSCTKVIEIEIPKDQRKQVFNCLFQPNEPFKASLSVNSYILDNFSDPINNATIKLYENNLLVDTLHFDGKYYLSDLIPIEGKKYSIQSYVEGLEVVKSQNTIPNPPFISNIQIVLNAYHNEDGDRVGQAIIYINDDVTQTNYYELEILRTTECTSCGDNNLVANYLGFDNFINDPVLINEDLLNYYPDSFVFSDALFNGKNYILKANFWNVLNQGESDKRYKIFLRTITKEYYEFKKKLIKHTTFQDGNSNLFDVTLESVPMYSNIENGFGIFAGYNELQFDFEY